MRLGLAPAAVACPSRFLCCAGATGCAPSSGGAPGLTRQSFSRSRAAAFTFECAAHRARACRRRLAPASSAFGQIALGLAFCPFTAAFRRRQLHTCAARFGQTNRNRLLWRSRAVFSFADMLHFFPNEFAGLRGWRKPFAFVLASAFNCILFWHNNTVSPPRPRSDADAAKQPRGRQVLTATKRTPPKHATRVTLPRWKAPRLSCCVNENLVTQA